MMRGSFNPTGESGSATSLEISFRFAWITMNNWDFSISKRNDITERVYLQFTAEFFNAFNHVRFGTPNISSAVQPSAS